MDEALPVIEIRSLTYAYPEQPEPALRDVTLTVRRGEFMLLMGRSGCGKSTLALCLNGIIPHMLGGRLEGEVRVMGVSPQVVPVYETATRIGLVFQDPDSQICNIFVRDEVAFGPQNLLVDKQEILRRVERMLRFVGLPKFEHRTVFLLSGGEKQRVAIASVLAMEPEVIVFDEPTANLDPDGATEVRQLIREVHRQGKTVVLIEHDVSEFVDVADRVAVMDGGRILYVGSPREVFSARGLELRDRLGLWIPETVEFALHARRKHLDLVPFPLQPEDVPVERLPFRTLHGIAEGQLQQSRAPSAPPIARLEEVSFRYPEGVEALHNISLSVPRGQIVALLGHNGSGKSTLASLLIGLNKPTSGRVLIDGLDTTQTSIRQLARVVGYVFQYPEHQFITDSVYREVAFSLQREGLSPDQIHAKVMDILRAFRLDHVLDRHPFALSKGQKRRLSVATMLVVNPKLLILDEPTTGQDYDSVLELMKYLLGFLQQGLTVLLITHNMPLVARYAQHAVVLEQGRVVYDGPVLPLMTEELARRARYRLRAPDLFRLWYRADQATGGLPVCRTPAELADLLEVP